jgi:uncharacterized repeat protein (TIGR01451 family)
MSKKFTSLLLAALMLFGVITSSSVPAYAADGAVNYPLNSIVIKVEDAVTHSMLAGARFEIYYNNQSQSGGYGTLVATVDTDASGVIVVSGIPSGYYIVRQTVPPNNYHLSINNEQNCYIKPDGTSIEELVFSNYRYGGLVVILSDKDTGAPVGGATFSVTDVNNTAVGTSADGVYATDSKGEFYLENLPAGDYKITQLTAAQGYAMDASPNIRTVRLQHTNADQSVFRATFENSPLGSLLVRLKDSVSKEPLSGAVFNVKLSGGADLGEFTTGANGTFLLPKIARGTYIISQVSAPAGYLTASAKTQYVNYVETYAADFENSPKSGLFIVKIDADTKEPLKDAKFRVYRDSAVVGAYTTNADGAIAVPNLEPGWYTVSEYAAPQGYVLDDTPQSVQVTSEQLHRLTFEDRKLASLQIIKTDEYDGTPLSGAKFRVTTQAGGFVADVTTDASGRATVPGVSPGWYVISETNAPAGYLISESARTVEVRATVPTVVTVTNRAENNLEIVKLDYFTRAPLAGATFKVEHGSGANVGTYNTDSAGKILVAGLKEDTYVISEIKAPEGYQLDSEPQIVVIAGGKLQSAEFLDKPLSGIEILKLDAYTHAPLSGATFTLERDNGEKLGKYVTDIAGKIIIPGLEAGTYIVSETIAPEGYMLDAPPQTVIVKNGRLTAAEFADKPLSGIEILKTDATTGAPLAGAVFTIERTNGERIGKYTTDVAGKIVAPDFIEGVYIISEVKAPDGYILDIIPQTVTVKSGKLTVAEFANTPFPTLYIKKTDAATGELLAGAVFTVANQNGEIIAEAASSASGAVALKVAPGVYVITEIKAPAGYELNDPIQTVEVLSDGRTVYFGGAAVPGNTATFANRKLNTLEIVKLDAVTHNPLSGAMFTVDKANGERIGSYRTDASGKILIPDLTEGTYVIGETAAPDGYILDSAPRTVTVKSGKLTVAEFTNKPLAGLQIIKLDSVSRAPIEGAEFAVAKMDGGRVGSFRTDAAGTIFVSSLEPGWYTVTETKAAAGYIPDSEPQNAEITYGKSVTLEILNTPMSGLLIVKTDAQTGKPLADVKFEVKKPGGEQIGIFTTDASGQIRLADVPAGTVIVTETQALDGYEPDTTAREVTISEGGQATLEVTNTQKSGFRLLKIDSVTKKPIYGAEFMVFDANNRVVGNYVTDNNGVIDFDGILPEGRYTVRETKPAEGYCRDDMPRTVEFVSGKTTEVVWENTPEMGQIQILKLSGDDNEVNGLPKGTPLAGAVFEIYAHRSGNLIDRFVSGTDGRAVSKPLPLGRYTVKEVQAPEWYRLSTETMDIEVEFATQIIKLEFLNYPANTGVRIKKTGNYEAMPGDTIGYGIKEVQNTGTVPLTDFYWRDTLPVDAARLQKIVTGTYNQSLKYKILAATNKGDTKIIADNLSTTRNNVIDCRGAALGLANDEYVTSFTLIFGTVKAGFAQVEQPQVFVKVQPNLPNGCEFANKADAGGKYGSEWVVGNSTWLTTIYAQPGKLPRTGY